MTRFAWALLLVGCGRSPIYLGCEQPADCPVPDDVTAECLDKSGDGFCTWACKVDADCAWDEDEFARVCASFESEGGLHCFPSCEDAPDAPDACPDGFTCRSTGGGSDNRHVCFPNDLQSTATTSDPGTFR
jgi:hypothetical protein